MKKFPNDFMFGAATAAYQSEGSSKIDGKGRVLWDHYLEEKGQFSPDPACDFYNRFPEDIELCRRFGIQAIRVSIAWSRLFPTGKGPVEKRGVEYYHRLFRTLKEQNITVFVTLHHFDTPEALYLKGDWLNRENIDYFVHFAKYCFEEFKEEVTYWITINEPTTLAKQQNIAGTFPPGRTFDFERCYLQQHHLNLAHARVVNEFKKMNIKGEIGIVHAIQTIYPYSNDEDAIEAAKRQDNLENKFLLDGTLAGTYSNETLEMMNNIITANHQETFELLEDDLSILARAAQQLDFVGINYYYSKFIKAYNGPSQYIHNGTGKAGVSIRQLHGVGEEVFRDDLPKTEWDWSIYPRGLGDTLQRIKEEYPKIETIYITENGIGQKELPDSEGKINDQLRIDYLKQHLNEILKAIDSGVNVKGYFVWSLQDLFSWTNGYNKRYGLFYVDFETQKRLPKESAYWYKKITETRTLSNGE